MNPKVEKPRPERDSTDGSLRAERDKTDIEFARKRAAIEEIASEIVDRARHQADEVVQTARSRADRKAEEQTAPEARSLEAARAGEDGVLQAERLRADVSVRLERQERKRALASLLRLEREETDEHLLLERGRSDDALSTRDVFLAMVSHDLRTLLGGIVLTAELLETEVPADEGGKAIIRARAQMIQRSAARMNRIIGDLVDIASIEAGKLVVQPVLQDLTGLVKEAIQTFQPSAAARAITLGWAAPAQPVLALVDHDRIVQVLANLLTNAIKFTSKGGRISVRLEAIKGAARVSITDTGPGIPADHLEAIFGRFWQGARRDRRGLGLGLYISRCILEGHRGRIWAESVAGVGSTFCFTVPDA